jgi:hypothetical protein
MSKIVIFEKKINGYEYVIYSDGSIIKCKTNSKEYTDILKITPGNNISLISEFNKKNKSCDIIYITEKGIYCGEVKNNKVNGYRFLNESTFTLYENSKGENNKKLIIFNKKRKRHNDNLINLFNVANDLKKNKAT